MSCAQANLSPPVPPSSGGAVPSRPNPIPDPLTRGVRGVDAEAPPRVQTRRKPLQLEESRAVKPSYLTSRSPALVSSISLLLSILSPVPRPVRAGELMPTLGRDQASGFARLALKGLGKEYPNKPEHVLA